MNIQDFINKENQIWNSLESYLMEFARFNFLGRKSGFSYIYCDCQCLNDSNALLQRRCEDIKKQISLYKQSLPSMQKNLENLLLTQIPIDMINVNVLTQNELNQLNQSISVWKGNENRIQTQIERSGLTKYEMDFNIYSDMDRLRVYSNEYDFLKSLNYKNRLNQLLELREKIESLPPKPSYSIESYIPRTTTTTSQSNPLIALLGLGLLLNMG